MGRVTPYGPGEFERMHAHGARYIGSSFAPALVLPPEKRQNWMASPYSRALDMLGIRDLPPVDDVARRGKLLEATTIACLQEQDVEATPLHAYAVHDKCDRWIASPDFETPDCYGEGKAPCNWEEWTESPPLNVQLQAQWQMGCANTDRHLITGLFVDKFSIELRQWPIERHEGAIKLMEDRAAWFLDLIDAGKTPEADESESSYQALQEVMPIREGARISLDSLEAADRLLAWRQARIDRKAADAVEDASKFWFAARCGDAEIIEVGGEPIYRKSIEANGKKRHWRWSLP